MSNKLPPEKFYAYLIDNLKAQIRECYGAFASVKGDARSKILENFGPYTSRPFTGVWELYAPPSLIVLVRHVEDLTQMSFVDWFDKSDAPAQMTKMLAMDMRHKEALEAQAEQAF